MAHAPAARQAQPGRVLNRALATFAALTIAVTGMAMPDTLAHAETTDLNADTVVVGDDAVSSQSVEPSSTPAEPITEPNLTPAEPAAPGDPTDPSPENNSSPAASGEVPAPSNTPDAPAAPTNQEAPTSPAAPAAEGSFSGDTASPTAPSEHTKDPQTGKDLLYRQHVDGAHVYWDKATQRLAVGVIDGATLRNAGDVAIRLGPDADAAGTEVSRLKIPGDGLLAFLGEPGEVLWNAPQEYTAGGRPVYAGYGAGQLPDSVDTTSLRLELVDARGPQDSSWVSLWSTSASIPSESLTSRKDHNRSFASLTPGGHGHFNWTFSEPGRYSLAWRAHARTLDGQEISSEIARVDWLVGTDEHVALPAGTTQGATITTSAESIEIIEDDVTPTDTNAIEGNADDPTPGSYTCLVPGHADLRITRDQDGELMQAIVPESGESLLDGTVVIPVPDRAASQLSITDRSKTLRALGETGTRIWTLPEVQDSLLAWPGMSTEHLDYDGFNSDGVRQTISYVYGPGRVVVWSSDIAKGAQRRLDSGQLSRSISFAEPAHQHFNTSFNAAGLYKVAYSALGEFVNDGTWMDTTFADYEVYYAVGDDAVQRLCGEEFIPPLKEEPSNPGDQGNPGNSDGQDNPGDSTPPVAPGTPQDGHDLACKIPGATTVIDSGHVDIFDLVADESGKLELKLKEDVTGAGVAHEPESVHLKVKPTTLTTLPKHLLDGKAGYLLTQTQTPGELWPGWDTQAIRAGGYTKAKFEVKYTGPKGGAISIFLLDGLSQKLVSRLADGGFELKPDGSTVLQDYPAHAHVNWLFSTPGRYTLQVTAKAAKVGMTDENQWVAAEPQTYTIDVGEFDCVGDKPGSSATPSPTPNVPAPAAPAPQPAPPAIVPPAGNGQAPTTILQCIATEVTREATAAEAKALAAYNAPANTATTRLNIVVGASGGASSGHFDIGPVITNGALNARVKDDRVQPAPWVDPTAITFTLGQAAQIKTPDSLSFAAQPSTTAWLISSTQTPGVPWLGMNSQHPSIVGGTTGPVSFSLAGVSGPGRVAVFESGALGGGVGNVLFNGPGSSFTLPGNTHAHYNWLFTAPGSYTLTLRMSVTPTGAPLRGTYPGTAQAPGISPTGQTGPNGLPMVTETVGRDANGNACELPQAEADRLAAAARGAAAPGPAIADAPVVEEPVAEETLTEPEPEAVNDAILSAQRPGSKDGDTRNIVQKILNDYGIFLAVLAAGALFAAGCWAGLAIAKRNRESGADD